MINKISLNSIILGDAYEIIKEIENNSIDLVVIDPPYLIDKGGSGKGRVSKSLLKLTEELEESKITQGIKVDILDEFMRIMKKPNIYIWCNKKQILDYLNYFVGIHKCSFEILTWIKSNPIPTCGRNYLNDKEYCLYFRKSISLHTTYKSGKTYWITPTNVKDKKLYNHPTIKPLPIIKTLIENSTSPGDIVFDCFLGSGTTAVACKALDRNYIAIEKNVKYFETSVKRLNSL